MVYGGWVYVLELENGKWYVGFTESVEDRVKSHKRGNAADWTELHTPIRIDELIPDGSKEIEKEKTIELMIKYGFENVRGGPWAAVDTAKPSKFSVSKHGFGIDGLYVDS